MDDGLRIFLWIVGGAGFFGLLGTFFGGIVGVVTRMSDRAAGTRLGHAVAASITRISDEPLSDKATGAIVGGTDGAFFLGMLGGVGGAVAGYRGDVDPVAGLYVGCGAVLLALGAVVFGMLAHGMVQAGVWALGGVFTVGILGALLGDRLGGGDRIFYGITGGSLLGIVLGILAKPSRKKAKRKSFIKDKDDGNEAY